MHGWVMPQRVLTAREGCLPVEPSVQRYRQLLRRYFSPEWPSALALLALLLGITAVQLAQPRLLAAFLNEAGRGAPVGTLLHPAVWFLALAVIGQGAGVARAYLGEAVGLTATNRVRADLLRHCLDLDLSFHDQHGPGELIQRIDGDMGSLVNFFSSFLPTLAGSGLLLAGVLVMLSVIAWPLGAALGVLSAGVLLLLLRMRGVTGRRWEGFMQAQAGQSAFLEEHLGATEDLRACGAGGDAMRRCFEPPGELGGGSALRCCRTDVAGWPAASGAMDGCGADARGADEQGPHGGGRRQPHNGGFGRVARGTAPSAACWSSG